MGRIGTRSSSFPRSFCSGACPAPPRLLRSWSGGHSGAETAHRLFLRVGGPDWHLFVVVPVVVLLLGLAHASRVGALMGGRPQWGRGRTPLVSAAGGWAGSAPVVVVPAVAWSWGCPRASIVLLRSWSEAAVERKPHATCVCCGGWAGLTLVRGGSCGASLLRLALSPLAPASCSLRSWGAAPNPSCLLRLWGLCRPLVAASLVERSRHPSRFCEGGWAGSASGRGRFCGCFALGGSSRIPSWWLRLWSEVDACLACGAMRWAGLALVCGHGRRRVRGWSLCLDPPVIAALLVGRAPRRSGLREAEGADRHRSGSFAVVASLIRRACFPKRLCCRGLGVEGARHSLLLAGVGRIDASLRSTPAGASLAGGRPGPRGPPACCCAVGASGRPSPALGCLAIPALGASAPPSRDRSALGFWVGLLALSALARRVVRLSVTGGRWRRCGPLGRAEGARRARPGRAVGTECGEIFALETGGVSGVDVPLLLFGLIRRIGGTSSDCYFQWVTMNWAHRGEQTR